MKRLRLGILLFVVSWLPIAQILLWIAHNHNKLTSEHSSQIFRICIWTFQLIIGVIGVWLAGKIVIKEAKGEGWKKAPRRLWKLFWHGDNSRT
jgi:hypothetical protein